MPKPVHTADAAPMPSTRLSTFFITRSPAFLYCLGLLLALGHALLAVSAVREKSMTSDELGHLTGGYTFDQLQDFRMHPENGVLPQRWHALPAVLAGACFPPLNQPAWREANVWQAGHEFLFRQGNNHEWLLFAARSLNALFGSATVLLVFCWSHRLFGWPGAFVAGLFCALDPTMLAHSALATSDMAMTFFLLASAGAYWRHLQTGRGRDWALSATVFGLACVAKYSAVLLLPIMAVMALVRALQPAPLAMAGRVMAGRGARLGAIGLSTLGHGAVAVLVIWAFFGFRYTAFNPQLPGGDFGFSWEYVLSFGGPLAAMIECCRHWHLLPEGFLYGLSFVLKLSEARGAFLDGDYSIHGWMSFFPKAFLYKTPEPLLLALAAVAGLTLQRIRADGQRWWSERLSLISPLAALFAVYWIFSLTSHLNIGHRHIVPTYPVLYIATGLLGAACGRAARAQAGGRAAAVAFILTLLSAQAFISWKIYPHYLAYFNRIAGGPENGYRHLVDSSLDWGQDLPSLADWLRNNNHGAAIKPVYLSYFGTSEPDYYGIQATRLPFINGLQIRHQWYQPGPGLYCISATMLQHVYSPVRGPWTLAQEKEYQELRALDPVFRGFFAQPAGRAEPVQTAPRQQWERGWVRYDLLRLARLCHYLRARRPDAMIGYSLLIYRLDAAEVNAVLDRSYSVWLKTIEEAGTR